MRRWTRQRRWLALAGVLVLLAAGAAVRMRTEHDQSVPKSSVVTLEFRADQLVHPGQRTLDAVVSLPGTVTPVHQAAVRARISGNLDEVLVREGDSVVAGTVMARFDTAPLRAVQAERSAELAQAKANLISAQRTREANAQLVQQSFITQNAFDTADANFKAQAAAVESAQARLAQIQLQIEDAVVRAPIDGQVSVRQAQPGEKVAQDALLFSIVDLSRLEVQAQADVADAARLSVGQAAEVIVEGLDGQVLSARVDRINPAADATSRALPIYVDFVNPGRRVRAGMFAHVRLHLGAGQTRLSVPIPAVQTDAGQSIVWEVLDGHLVRHLVTVGRRDEGQQLLEILAGVDEHANILASRFDGLVDGAPARILTSKGG